MTVTQVLVGKYAIPWRTRLPAAFSVSMKHLEKLLSCRPLTEKARLVI